MHDYKLEGRVRNDGLINIYVAGTDYDVALCVRPTIASLFINSPELLKALREMDDTHHEDCKAWHGLPWMPINGENDCDCGVLDRKILINKTKDLI